MPADEVQRRVEAARKRLTQNEGGRRVLRAIEAHGGLEAWCRAPTSSYTWEYANKDVDVRFKSFLIVDNRTRRAYHDLLTTGSYEQARPMDGLTVPTRFKGYPSAAASGRDEALRNEAFADSISYRRPFDASTLNPPEGARFVSLPGAE